MTKQKLVRPQMTVEARDILKSWDGETNSEKVRRMNSSRNFLAEVSENRSIYISELLSNRSGNDDSKARNLSALAYCLVISICINLAAIGWVAKTNGWLS